MQFSLPRFALPDNKLQRRQKLEQYFALDLIPFEQLQDNVWTITTFIPEQPEYYIDFEIEKNLKKWIGEVPLNALGLYKRFYKNAMISLVDSWSLYYWSLAISWLTSHRQMPQEITLLHIDDHRDLDSPLLVQNHHQYFSIFSGEQVDFFQPKTIEKALIEKSINIGSFITPFLHALEKVQILHLRYAQATPLHNSYVECIYQEDDLLAPGKLRPALQLAPSNQGRHSYNISSNLKDFYQQLESSSLIFLHIDCDGFNNRYNGDSHWHFKRPSIDLKANEIFKKIDELFYDLSTLSKQLFINIALSPGFFPSEYWKNVVEHLIITAERYHLLQEDNFSNYLKNLHPQEVYYGLPSSAWNF